MTGAGGRTAVVCEDEPDKRAAVGRLLELAGCRLVAETASLPELRASIEQTAPDVVVLDLALTGLHGLDVVRDLHVVSPESAIIVMSTFSSLRLAALEAGARALVDVDDLRELDAVLTGLRLPLPRDAESLDTGARPAAGQDSAASGSVTTKSPS